MVKLTREFVNRKSRIFHLETSEAKLFPNWKPLTIILYYIYQAQQTNTCWRSTIETLEQDVKYVKIRPRHLQDDVFDFVLVSSLLTLNIFHTLSCLYCWIWTGKYLLQTCVIAHSMYTGPERHHCPTVVIVNLYVYLLWTYYTLF